MGRKNHPNGKKLTMNYLIENSHEYPHLDVQAHQSCQEKKGKKSERTSKIKLRSVSLSPPSQIGFIMDASD